MKINIINKRPSTQAEQLGEGAALYANLAHEELPSWYPGGSWSGGEGSLATERAFFLARAAASAANKAGKK